MFSSIIYNVKAWFDDYDLNTILFWDDANFYVHIKSKDHHRVYGRHGDKKLDYVHKKLSGLSNNDESVCSRMLLIQ